MQDTEQTLPDVPSDVYNLNVNAQLMGQLLDKLPPLLAEGLCLAAVPLWYDTALIQALRQRQDGRDEKLVERLAQFSFVRPATEGEAGASGYTLTDNERDFLNRRWLADDPPAYLDAHRRALAFWAAKAQLDSFTHDQNCLYHQMVVECSLGLDDLRRLFQAYTGERRFAAAERLLTVAAEARTYLSVLKSPHLTELDDWLAYFQARLAQLQGQWNEAQAGLATLIHKFDIPFDLLPYITRAYGLGLARQCLYVEAIEQYEFALALFQKLPDSQDEQAFTMINLGNAHVDLAVSARGQRDIGLVGPATGPAWWRQLVGLARFMVSLPLIVYLSFYFGLRVWNPQSWPMLRGQDWILARLFGLSARWNRRADRLLALTTNEAERAQTDEKLAYLYLMMGDVAQAARLYQALLDSRGASLGEYRQARAQVGLGQALLRLGQVEAALKHLENALPMVETYNDNDLEAQTRGLMAEARLQIGQHTEALQDFTYAMRLYQKQDDLVGATEIAERMHVLGHSPFLGEREREAASTTTQALARRQYLVRFLHPAMSFFRRVALVPLMLLTFLIPVLSIQVETGATMAPHIKFYASALTTPTDSFLPSLDHVMSLTLQPFSNAAVAGWLVVGCLLCYFLVYILLGVVVIIRTQLATVQAARARALRIDLKGMSVGEGAAVRSLRWSDVTRLFMADVHWQNMLIAENSGFVVATPQVQLEVTGNTAWYTALRQRVGRFVSSRAQSVDLGYAMLRGKMGLLYGLSLLSLVAFIVLSSVASAWLTVDAPGLPYNAIDLYPYLYLGMFIALAWWGVIRPLDIHARTRPSSHLALWIGLMGLVLGGLRLATSATTWLTRPDIYPTLAVLILTGGAAGAMWIKCWPGVSGGASRYAYPTWSRLVALGVAVVVGVVAVHRLGREVVAYHYLVWGNTLRDRVAQTSPPADDGRKAQWLMDAVASYDHALQVFPESSAALTSRAAAQAQLGYYQAAVNDYDAMLQQRQSLDLAYLNRALAYERWGQQLAQEQADQPGQAGDDQIEQSLTDFDWLIARYPDNAGYYLWRGVAYHSLGHLEQALRDYQAALALNPHEAQALTGQGWVYYQMAHTSRQEATLPDNVARKQALQDNADQLFERALASFQAAAQYSPYSPEIWLAVGYAHYRLGQYQETVSALSQAVSLSPRSPDLYISRGVIYWRWARGYRCASSNATGQEKNEAAGQLELAVKDFNQALALRPDATVYRTRAQVDYALADCPGYSQQAQLQKAIDSYSAAIELSPQEDGYWQYRARLTYVLGRSIFNQGPDHDERARQVYNAAASDIRQAFAIAPQGPSDRPSGELSNQAWRDFIVYEGWGRYYYTRGETYYQAEVYSQARKDLERAAELLPADVTPALKAGLCSLALNQTARASYWYDEGIRRAQAAPDAGAAASELKAGLDDISTLLKGIPRLSVSVRPIADKLQLGLDALEGN